MVLWKHQAFSKRFNGTPGPVNKEIDSVSGKRVYINDGQELEIRRRTFLVEIGQVRKKRGIS